MILCRSLCISSVITYLFKGKRGRRREEKQGRKEKKQFREMFTQTCFFSTLYSHLLKEVYMRRLKDVQGRQYIFVFEVTEHFNFSVNSFTGDQV